MSDWNYKTKNENIKPYFGSIESYNNFVNEKNIFIWSIQISIKLWMKKF